MWTAKKCTSPESVELSNTAIHSATANTWAFFTCSFNSSAISHLM